MTRLLHRLQLLFRPARPRAAWLRVLLALAGLFLMVLMVGAALLLGVFWLAGRLLWRMAKPTAATSQGAGVIDGEFRVVPRRDPVLPSHSV